MSTCPKDVQSMSLSGHLIAFIYICRFAPDIYKLRERRGGVIEREKGEMAMLKVKTRTPFYGKAPSFTIGKEKQFNEINKKDLVEVKGIYLDKNTGRLCFMVDDEAYVENIVFVEMKNNKGMEILK